jgi:hypothetical protein
VSGSPKQARATLSSRELPDLDLMVVNAIEVAESCLVTVLVITTGRRMVPRRGMQALVSRMNHPHGHPLAGLPRLFRLDFSAPPVEAPHPRRRPSSGRFAAPAAATGGLVSKPRSPPW